ncbi:MAG: glutamine-hydrolyzing carbamoyl-phosphate synthase small subunit [Dehalococcoidia bacterium]
MSENINLVLEDGSVYEGTSFGADAAAHGEVVFNTSMMGYQEMLTDPSYVGQIVVCTYPLIGNYGINKEDFQSDGIKVAGFVVREPCDIPSHSQTYSTLHEYLKAGGIPGICGMDTRSLTRRLRSKGVMQGMISSEPPEKALKEIKKLPKYDKSDFVSLVGTKKKYKWEPACAGVPVCHVVVVDCGVKYSIMRQLSALGCACTVVPSTTSAEDILELKPDGILLSPGPGAPDRPYLEKTVTALIGKKPIMGICMGHQVLGRVFGAKTYKLKFGHRGGNHPVKDMETGRIRITAQNHGYAVDADSVKGGLEISHININDGTVEGLRHKEHRIFTIQYHSEACPGPMDSANLFEEFVTMMKGS